MPDLLHWEDFEPGQVIELGERTLTEAEIVEFAREWDPQYFHVDPEAAKRSPYGGLIASGWHTGVVWMRMYADRVLNRAAGLGGGGLHEIRWHVPTRPGDRLRGLALVVETAPTSRTPNRGKFMFRGELRNQRDELAMQLSGMGFLRRRHPAT